MTREVRRETLEAGRNADEGGHGGLHSTPARLSDADLLRRVVVLAAAEREATVELVAHLAELDARKLYLGQGYSSLFGYCTGVLRLAEHAAFNRIQAARASREFPAILELLADGSLNLSTVRLIAPHLRADTFEAVVTMARGRSRREVELLVAGLAPRPDVVSSVRKLAVPVHHAAMVPSTREQPAAEQPTVHQPAAEPPAVGRAVQASVMPASSLPEAGAFSPLALTTGLVTPRELADSRANGSSRSTESSWSPFSVPDAAGRPTQRPVVAPLAPGRYRVQFTVGEETYEKLQSVPSSSFVTRSPTPSAVKRRWLTSPFDVTRTTRTRPSWCSGRASCPSRMRGARGGPTRPGASHACQTEVPHAPRPKMWSPVRSSVDRRACRDLHSPGSSGPRARGRRGEVP